VDFWPSLLLAAAMLAGGFALAQLPILSRHRDSGRAGKEARHLRSLFDSPLAGIACFTDDGALLECNEKFVSLFGVDEAGEPQGAIRADTWRAEAVRLAQEARKQAPGELAEVSVLGVDGIRRLLSVRYWPTRLAAGTASEALWLLASDITRRQQSRMLQRLARQVYQCVSEAILITDVTTRIIDVNPAFERITGHSRETVVGMRAALLRSERHDADFFAGMWRQIAKDGCWKGEIWNRCRDGRVIPCWMHIDAVRDPASGEVMHYVGVFSDISERKLIEERFSFLAHHDALTGLANRFSLDAVLPHSIALARRNGSRVGLLFVDLDNFKNVNDSFGHAAGDQVLLEASRRMARSIRESDYLARIGGDEFVVVLNEIDGAEDALRIATAIRDDLRQPVATADRRITVTSSIGIALYPDDGDEAKALVAHADAAMYRVKANGRNDLRFFSGP